MPETGQAPSLPLFLEGVAKLFNDGVSKNLSRNALYFRFRFLPGNTAVESNFKILALADFLQPLKADLGQGSVNGFALWIEHAFLKRNENLSFHGQVELYGSPTGSRLWFSL